MDVMTDEEWDNATDTERRACVRIDFAEIEAGLAECRKMINEVKAEKAQLAALRSSNSL